MNRVFYSLVIVLWAFVATACSQNQASAVPLPVVRPAPDWVLTDVDGREVRSDEFKGKVVLVDFWATWCPPCLKEIPDYVALQKKYADQGLVILGFSVDELEPAEVKRFGEARGVNYRFLIADAGVAEAFGGVQALPTTFLIDREGRIRHVKIGLTNMAEYEEMIRSLL